MAYWEPDGSFQKCSNCKNLSIMPFFNGRPRFKFCPYCGADMSETEYVFGDLPGCKTGQFDKKFYRVQISQSFHKDVIVKASSENDAILVAKEKYDKGHVDITREDFDKENYVVLEVYDGVS